MVLVLLYKQRIHKALHYQKRVKTCKPFFFSTLLWSLDLIGIKNASLSLETGLLVVMFWTSVVGLHCSSLLLYIQDRYDAPLATLSSVCWSQPYQTSFCVLVSLLLEFILFWLKVVGFNQKFMLLMIFDNAPLLSSVYEYSQPSLLKFTLRWCIFCQSSQRLLSFWAEMATQYVLCFSPVDDEFWNFG